MDNNTFMILLYVGIFVVVVGHVYLKRLMGETIFRTEKKTENQKLFKTFPTSDNDDLLDYVKSHLVDLKTNQPEFSPKGSNFYSTTHDSDLHNDITDLSQYFEIEQSVPDTKQLLNKLQCKNNFDGCKTQLPV